MAHDVFICYSTQDKPIADAACVHLEASGIRCWIAPRDPIPGMAYSRQLVDAIDKAKIVLLIFSQHTAQSEHVMRELECAAERNRVILPFRIDSTEPSADLEYYIRRIHWLDAITPPMEKRLDELVTLARRILDATLGTSETLPSPQPPPRPIVPRPRSLPPLVYTGGGAALLVILLITVVLLRAHPKPITAQAPRPKASAAAAAWYHPYNKLKSFYADGVACVSKGNGTSVQIYRLYNGSDEPMYYDVGVREVYPEGNGETVWAKGANGGYRWYLQPKQESDDYHASFSGRCSSRYAVTLFDVRYRQDSGKYVALN